ncbi:MAG: hypothetical protein AAGN66_27975, partial [Acidobacteriota bacterium]
VSDDPDTLAVLDPTVTLITDGGGPQAPVEIPTAGTMGLLALVLGLGLAGVLRMRTPQSKNVVASSVGIVWIGALLLVGECAHAQCGDNTPAVPVPEFRAGVRIWSDSLRPGLPGQQLPADRDSTDRVAGTSIPGAGSGHELWKAVAAHGSTVFVAYNAGLTAWSVANPEAPVRVGIQDGWRGDFLDFPPPSEQLNFVEDLDVVEGPAGDLLIGVSGKDPVGPSLWRYSVAGGVGRLDAIYQDVGTIAREVRFLEDGGGVYMVVATERGPAIYDAALASVWPVPCLDDAGQGACPGVYLGRLPFPDSGPLFRYMDATTHGGRSFVVVSDGNFAPLEVWQVSPTAPSTSVRVVTGPAAARGVTFAETSEGPALAYVLKDEDRIVVRDVSDCLDGSGCSGLGPERLSWPVRPWPAGEEFLSFSRDGERSFLYYGAAAFDVPGRGVEQLLDITDLAAAYELTAGGGQYIDVCSGEAVDYWGDYNPGNRHGLRDLYGRHGVVSGGVFYRAAQTIFDAHVIGAQDPGTPRVVTRPSSPGPYYLGDSIGVEAVASNCPGAELWDWTSSGAAVGGLTSTSSTARFWVPLDCGASPCPQQFVDVLGVKRACAGAPDLEAVPAVFALADPRPSIKSLLVSPGGATLPACADVTFLAEVEGRSPMAIDWTIRAADGQVLGQAEGSEWTWSSAAVPTGSEIFVDGFEAADVGAWSRACGPGGCSAGRALQAFGGPVRIELEASNADGVASHTLTRSVASIGTVGASGLSSVALGDGRYRLTGSTSNATEWRWVIEDPANGSETECGGTGFARCAIVDWSGANSLVYRYETPNTPGTYGVRIQARNCQSGRVATVDREFRVTSVGAPLPPRVTRFEVDQAATPACNCSSALQLCECPSGTEIVFTIEASEATGLEVDWDGDGTFDAVLPLSGPFRRVYTGPGQVFFPGVRAVRGSATSAVVNCHEVLRLTI